MTLILSLLGGGKWKLILFIVGVLAVSILFSIRTCNQIQDEYENETIEIIDIDPAQPGDYNSICVRVSGKPCPPISK